MSLEEEIRERVLNLDGVAVVYSADPLWLTVVKQVGALLSPGDEAAQVPFVVCQVDGDLPLTTVRIRVGTDGSVPAPAVARDVAASIRSFVGSLHPGSEVVAAVEIAAIGV